MLWRSSSRATAGLLCLLIASTAFPTAAIAQGKGHGVEVRAVSAQQVETQPGQIVSASFSVTSASAQQEEFVERLDLPQGWQAVIPPASFLLDPQQTQVRLTAVLVPANTPAGTYSITYSVRSRRDYAIQDFDAITVVVQPMNRFALLVEEKPDVVIAGDTYQVTFRAVNQSNSDVVVSLEAASGLNNAVRLDTSVFELPRGNSRLVTATVTTDTQLKRRASDTLTVRAKAIGSGNTLTTAGVAVSIDIVPKVSGEADIYHRIPAEIELAATGTNGHSAVQAEFSGGGTIDEAGSKSIDFLFRGPDIQETSFFGLRDEYRLNYFTTNVGLRLGDQTYGLSPLTDYYRYGRGVEFSFTNPDGMSTGAYYLESRWSSPERRELGLHVGNQISRTTDLRLNVLTRTEQDTGVEDNLVSIEGTTKLFSDANLAFEVGAGRSDREGIEEGMAYRARLDGRAGEVSYSLGTIHASPDYYGYYHDSDYSNLSLNFPIGDKLRGNVSGQRWRRNLDRDDSQSDAPLEQYYQAGIDYNLAESTQLSLDYLRFSRRDLLEPMAYDIRENAVRLGLSQRFANSSLQFYYDIGRQRDLIDGDSRKADRYAVYYYLGARNSQYLSVYSIWGDDNVEESRLLGGESTVGASTFWRLSPMLSLAMNYAVNRFDENYFHESRQFYATAVYASPDDHIWTFRLRNSDLTSGAETSYLLSHTIPFGIAGSRKLNIAAIHGRIYDAEQPDKPGIARVVVTANGASSVSDEKGEFVFHALEPGPYNVTVDKRSIGLDRITSEKLPMVVELAQGQTADLQIPVLRSARLQAKASLLEYQSDIPGGSDAFLSAPGTSSGVVDTTSRPAEVGGLRDMLVELTSGTEIVRASTDADGELMLADLRPGQWHVKVYDHNVPAFHYIERAEFDVELKPGETLALPIQILPKLRQIRIIESDTIR